MQEKECFTNRELSWLSFNERVLDEAGNSSVPLAERPVFASIYQTNLDEFFMVRVGSLRMQQESGDDIRENKTNMKPSEQISAILERVKSLEEKKSLIYSQLMGEIERQGIRLINFNKLSDDEGKILEQCFDTEIAPFLSPMIVGKQQPFPFLANKELYAAVFLISKSGKSRIGIVSCSSSVFKRLIEIPSRPGNFMLCEDLILHFAKKLFPHHLVQEKTLARITRNADIDENDALDEDIDYRHFMEGLLKQRKRMDPVRLELSRELSYGAKAELCRLVKIPEEAVINTATPLDMKFIFEVRDALRSKSQLFYRKRSSRSSRDLSIRKKIIPQIEKKDALLFYPYESMKPFINLLHEAANDKSVFSIKITLYRLADKSKIVDALVEAAENGKEVVVLIELRARFDEAANIDISHRLEDAGCLVLYGLGSYKVHSKLCLLTRHTSLGLSYITQIGTGNYNEKTAGLYTDFSLITADKKIGEDAANIFKNFQLGETVENSGSLLVAPRCFQSRIIDLIEEEIKKAEDGKEAYVGIKINSLTDKLIINKLIEASQAGVKIEMCIRGICCLVPGVKEKTENIKVVSIVGRFLEHSRIYIFGKEDKNDPESDKIFIGSADFMTRNMERRVEVGVPLLSRNIKARVRHIFNLVMSDTEKGRSLMSDGEYSRRNTAGSENFNSQEYFYEEAYKAARETRSGL